MNFPTLYKQAKTGKIQEWAIATIGEEIVTRHGKLGGTMQEARKKAKGKNIGKANETTAEKQAELTAQSMWNKKKDKGYFESVKEAEEETVFLPMLATDMLKMSKKRVEEIYSEDFFTQPKMDGVRCLACWDGDNISLMSRGGKPYEVKHLQELLKDIILPGQVLDGELYIHHVLRQDIQALVKKHRDEPYADTGKSSKDIELWVYDSFMTDNLDMPFKDRLALIEKLPNINFVRSVKSVLWQGGTKHTKDNLKAVHKGYTKSGFEGTIIRIPDGKYELGHRSRDLIKYKDFMDKEFKIVGVKDGDGKFEGCAVWICALENGETVDVTPKGSLEQKKKWFQEADKHIGKLLTVKFQGYTKDGSLEFPVGLGFRLPEDL